MQAKFIFERLACVEDCGEFSTTFTSGRDPDRINFTLLERPLIQQPDCDEEWKNGNLYLYAP